MAAMDMWCVMLILLALASCAEVEDTAERHPIRAHVTWHFPPGLHKPVRHYFPYGLPDKEVAR